MSKLLNYNKIHLFGIELAFSQYRRHQNSIETFLKNEQKIIKEQYESLDINLEAKKAVGNEREYLAYLQEEYAEQYYERSMTFPHYFRTSFFVQLFSFFEFELSSICENHHLNNETDFVLKDLKGNSEIEKAKLYLTKCCKVDIESLNPEWDFLNKAKELRNVLVHHQGQLKKDTSKRWNKLAVFAKDNKLTLREIVKNNLYELLLTDKTLNNTFIDVLERFFKKLLEEELKSP